MTGLSTKAIESISRRMSSLDENSIRYRILENAKSFKTSWIGLGQALYSVWKDRLYRDWGYMTFDAYTSKEIGIKKLTAMKLLKTYYFLEKEEPEYLDNGRGDSRPVGQIPGYESVNVLRLAKSKNELDKSDYVSLRRGVFELGRDAREVKRDLTVLMKQKEELAPEEARRAKRSAVIKRLLGTLKALRTDIEASKMLPAGIIRDTGALIKRIETELTG